MNTKEHPERMLLHGKTFSAQMDGLCQLKVQHRLRGDGNVLVAGKGWDACARSSSCQAPAHETHPPGGHAANQHAKARSAADEACCTFAFALLGARQAA